MKNLFEPKVKDEIISRIETLTPQSKALWGKMNVMQGMRHMAMAFDISTGKLDPHLEKEYPLPKWLIKFLLINVKAPKGRASTFKEMDLIKNNINPEDFNLEKHNLKKTVENFYNVTQLIPANKYAGKFSKNDWGKVNYNHTDHHLRQFGA